MKFPLKVICFPFYMRKVDYRRNICLSTGLNVGKHDLMIALISVMRYKNATDHFTVPCSWIFTRNRWDATI